jgi:hypothetical protein
MKSQYVRDQLRPLFPDQAAYDKFVDAVTNERTMFGTRQQVLGGSQTAARHAEDGSSILPAGASHAAHAVMHAKNGNVLGTLARAAAAVKERTHRPNPELDAAIARLLTGQTGASDGAGNALIRMASKKLPHTQNALAKLGRQLAPYAAAGAAPYGAAAGQNALAALAGGQ